MTTQRIRFFAMLLTVGACGGDRSSRKIRSRSSLSARTAGATPRVDVTH